MIKLAKDNILLEIPTQQFNFDDPQMDPEELRDTLISHIKHYNGPGISANQIGLPYSVFALNSDPFLVCFNPIVTYESDETETLEEYDLSYPGLVLKMKRPKLIRARFADPAGNIGAHKFQSLTARYFIHHNDWLQGISFLKIARRFHKEAAIKRLTKLQKYNNIEHIRIEENLAYESKMKKETV